MPRLVVELRQLWERFWALPRLWKGSVAAGAVAVFVALIVGVILATGGGGNTAVSEIVRGPTPTTTAKPTAAPPTPKLAPTPTPTTLSPAPAPSPPPLPSAPEPESPPPPPAPAPTLTAAEVIECEFGQNDGWDDAFNFRPNGFTAFPASLTLTTDPVDCEALWHTAYDDGYASGRTDTCSIVSDYIEVASPEELEFCDLEPPPPPPPPSPPSPPPPPPSSGTILLAQNGQFLGVVTCNEFDTDGIFNRFGSYGSRFSGTSIWNRFGTYGGQFGTYSPFNRFGQPPEILNGTTLVAYLTVSTVWLPVITPEALVLQCFSLLIPRANPRVSKKGAYSQ